MEYLITKWLHVLAAIIALGANLTYGVWSSLASREPASLRFALRGISFLDGRIANPAYIVLLVTGALMIFLINLPLTTPWLMVAIILYLATALIGIFAYSPALRQQVLYAEGPGPSSPEVQHAARTGLRLDVLTVVLVMAIVFLMVVKPALWNRA